MEDNVPKKRGRPKKDDYTPIDEKTRPNTQVKTWLVEMADKAEEMKAGGAIVMICGPMGVRYGAIGNVKNDPIVLDAIRYLISKPQDIG